MTSSPADLAREHLARFDRTGNHEDLDHAIEAARTALADAPEGHPRHVVALSLLGAASIAAYEATEDRQRLREAVDVLRRAERLSVGEGYPHAVVVSNLAAALVGTARRSGRPDAVREAVETARRAVRLLEVGAPSLGEDPATMPDGPVGHRLASAIGNLVGALLVSYQRSDDLDALQEAVHTGRRAVALARDSDRWALLVNLSTAERTYHERMWAPEMLRAAVGHARQAAGVERRRHHAGEAEHLAVASHALGEALETAAGAVLGPDAGPAVDEAASAFRRAARAENGPTEIRARSAASWGRLATLRERHAEAAEALALAIDLLEASLAEPRHDSDRQHRLLPFTGLACDAAAGAARLGRHGEAVRLLERGRGVLIARALDLLGAPELVGPGPAPDLPAEGVSAPFGRDKGATHRIAIINTSAYGPYASIVTIDGAGPDTRRRMSVRHVALPDFELSDLGTAVYDFSRAVAATGDETVTSGGTEPDLAMSQVLAWLWQVIARPVLEDGLGLTSPPRAGEPWPRLWWCPTGELSLLPLHAAGLPGHPAGSSVLDRVVSSYTATMRALLHATSGEPARGRGRGSPGDRVLVIEGPRVPGGRDLPGARREVDLVRSVFPDVTVLAGDDARSRAVRAQLGRHSWVHFAGHAALSADPEEGSTLLIPVDDGRPLSVHDIRRLRVPGAEVAVLSACGTATPLRALPDESLHLATAFQLAGYRHVTATLWPVTDPHALRMARSLYRQVARADEPRSDALPLSLHHAVRQLRHRWPDRPTIWAAHVHAGA